MDAVRKQRIQRDWLAVFADFDGSGMTIKEFCLSRGMSQSLFYRRRKDYADSRTPGEPAFGRADFIELTPTSLPRCPRSRCTARFEPNTNATTRRRSI